MLDVQSTRTCGCAHLPFSVKFQQTLQERCSRQGLAFMKQFVAAVAVTETLGTSYSHQRSVPLTTYETTGLSLTHFTQWPEVHIEGQQALSRSAM
jgi:hypothetical protein